MDREKIIADIKDSRNRYGPILDRCPFEGPCILTCGDMFPKWMKKNCNPDMRWPVNGIHPCNFYGKAYVKRRMKKLFPELYNGKGA